MKPRRVLIVDDAPEFARLIQDALSTMPYPLETKVILSGEEAWLEASKTRYDLVITDLRLPGIPGTELVRRVRARYPDIVIIAISGLEEAGLNERTREAGADAFYRKPLELPSLLTKIDNLLFPNEPSDDITHPQFRRPSKQDTTPIPVKNVNPLDISQGEKENILEIEKRLHHLLVECGAEGIALSNASGQIIARSGCAKDFELDNALLDALSVLRKSLKSSGHQSLIVESFGLLMLPGLEYDLITANLGNYHFWIQFASGSSAFFSGKAIGVWNTSRNHLMSLLEKVDELSVSKQQPVQIPDIDPTDTRVVPIETESEKVDTGKLVISPLPRENVDAFWNEIDSTKSNSGFSPGTISFDQATSMGIVPEDET